VRKMLLGSRNGIRFGRRNPAKALSVNPANNNPPTTNKTRFRLIATRSFGSSHQPEHTDIARSTLWEKIAEIVPGGGSNTLAHETRKSRRFTNCADGFSAQSLAHENSPRAGQQHGIEGRSNQTG